MLTTCCGVTGDGRVPNLILDINRSIGSFKIRNELNFENKKLLFKFLAFLHSCNFELLYFFIRVRLHNIYDRVPISNHLNPSTERDIYKHIKAKNSKNKYKEFCSV